MDPGPLRDVLTAVVGVATGVLSGMFGVGGGVISQPGMRVLGYPPLVVIGTALPVIVPGAASGVVRYLRERLIRWPAVAATVPAGLAAAVVGSLLSEQVPGDGHPLQLATAVLLLVSARRMGRPDTETDPLVEAGLAVEREEGAPLATYAAIGAVAGLLSGLLGIGGGVIMVPAFVQFARMPLKPAIATSLACVGAFAVPGTITHVVLDHVDWRAAAALIAGVVPGARLGAHLTVATGDRRLRLVVSTFLAAVAVLYFVGELQALLA